jgi:HD-GYP domain-containing protein (c-di-GMP phosphodiesterase class II)
MGGPVLAAGALTGRSDSPMQVSTLNAVRSRIQLGGALPFSVRSADKTLLLAVGQVIHDEAQLEELFERGAVVEMQELLAVYGADDPLFAPAREPAAASAIPVAMLPRRWDECADRVASALSPEHADRLPAIDLATGNLLLLANRSTGLAMSQIVRQQAAGRVHYGVSHSMNSAIACLVTARTLGWSVEDQRRAMRAALTMNLSMVELQGRLAHQLSPLLANQRQVVQEHPLRSAEMLEAAGVVDTDWLDAVREHHETPDGKGYPAGLMESGELGQLLRFVDVYTALMSRRATRPGMSAREAGREIYEMAAGSTLCQAVIKTFGVFPPGSFVRLASGELGMVTRNGDKAYHPSVAALTNAAGQARKAPVYRDTADESHRIVALLPEAALPFRVTPEMLAATLDGDQH